MALILIKLYSILSNHWQHSTIETQSLMPTALNSSGCCLRKSDHFWPLITTTDAWPLLNCCHSAASSVAVSTSLIGYRCAHDGPMTCHSHRTPQFVFYCVSTDWRYGLLSCLRSRNYSLIGEPLVRYRAQVRYYCNKSRRCCSAFGRIHSWVRLVASGPGFILTWPAAR